MATQFPELPDPVGIPDAKGPVKLPDAAQNGIDRTPEAIQEKLEKLHQREPRPTRWDDLLAPPPGP